MPSKIYLLAFNGPISGYGIARKIQNLEHGANPRPQKIYAWADQMVNENMLKKTKAGYIAKTEVLLPQIKDFLVEEKKIQVSEIESYVLLKYLDSVNFRTHVEESFFYKKTFFKNAVDSVKHITEVLGSLSLKEYVCRDEEKDKKNEKYREYFHRVADFKTKREVDSYWTEHITPQIDYGNTAIKKILVTRLEEEDYFERTGKFIKNGHYEYFEKNNYIAKNITKKGKEIKYWICHPEYVTFLPSSLIKKLYKVSAIYDLFQNVDHRALFALLLTKGEKLFPADLREKNIKYLTNFWQEPQENAKIKKIDKTALKHSLEEQEKLEEEQIRLKEEQRKQGEEQLKNSKLNHHMKQIERLTEI
ncbi:MAG: hypothetical protein LBE70_05070 [Nitrososphaerota archaeon]|jgi:hypothetical protein|nr:hypothetical protein [Nitrososphaerota archaeon]